MRVVAPGPSLCAVPTGKDGLRFYRCLTGYGLQEKIFRDAARLIRDTLISSPMGLAVYLRLGGPLFCRLLSYKDLPLNDKKVCRVMSQMEISIICLKLCFL